MTTRTATNAPGLKATLGVLAAVVTYLVTQEVLDLPLVADVALNALGVGLAVYLGKPQPTVTVPGANREAGYSVVEALLVVFLAVVILIVLLRFV